MSQLQIRYVNESYNNYLRKVINGRTVYVKMSNNFENKVIVNEEGKIVREVSTQEEEEDHINQIEPTFIKAMLSVIPKQEKLDTLTDEQNIEQFFLKNVKERKQSLLKVITINVERTTDAFKKVEALENEISTLKVMLSSIGEERVKTLEKLNKTQAKLKMNSESENKLRSELLTREHISTIKQNEIVKLNTEGMCLTSKIEELEDELKTKEYEYNVQKEGYERIIKQLQLQKENIQKSEVEKKEIEIENNRITKEITKLIHEKDEIFQILKTERENNSKENEIRENRISEINEKVFKIQEIVQEKDTRIMLLNRQIEGMKQNEADYNIRVAEQDRKITALAKTGKGFFEENKKLKTKINELEKKEKKAKNDLNKAEEEAKFITKEIKTLKIDKQALVEKEQNLLKELNQEKVKSSELVFKLKTLEEEAAITLSKNQAIKDKIDNVIDEYNKEIVTIPDTKNDIDSLTEIFNSQTIEGKIDGASKIVFGAVSMLKEFAQKIKENRERIANLKQKLSAERVRMAELRQISSQSRAKSKKETLLLQQNLLAEKIKGSQENITKRKEELLKLEQGVKLAWESQKHKGFTGASRSLGIKLIGNGARPEIGGLLDIENRYQTLKFQIRQSESKLEQDKKDYEIISNSMLGKRQSFRHDEDQEMVPVKILKEGNSESDQETESDKDDDSDNLTL